VINTLPAGLLTQRVTIQVSSANVDVLGQRVESWTTFATVWAQAQPLRGRELFASGQMQDAAEVRFRIRYLAGVTSAMRVLWRTVPHAIIGEPIDVDGAKHTLELMCAAGVRDGR
jgi:SPP1 family predicted phage head-tail adaptor